MCYSCTLRLHLHLHLQLQHKCRFSYQTHTLKIFRLSTPGPGMITTRTFA